MSRTLQAHNVLNVTMTDDETTAVLTVDGEYLEPDELVTLQAGALAAWIVGVVRLAVGETPVRLN